MKYIYKFLYVCFRWVNHWTNRAQMFFYICHGKRNSGKPMFQVDDELYVKGWSSREHDYRLRVTVVSPYWSLGEQGWCYLCHDENGSKVNYKGWALTKR